MAAVVMTPARVMTPEEMIEAHTDAIADIAKRLLAKNSTLEGELRTVHGQLNDALDAYHEAKTALRGKDQIIEELQAILVERRKK